MFSPAPRYTLGMYSEIVTLRTKLFEGVGVGVGALAIVGGIVVGARLTVKPV